MCPENISSTHIDHLNELYALPTVQLSQFCFEISFWVSVVAVIRISPANRASPAHINNPLVYINRECILKPSCTYSLGGGQMLINNIIFIF